MYAENISHTCYAFCFVSIRYERCTYFRFSYNHLCCIMYNITDIPEQTHHQLNNNKNIKLIEISYFPAELIFVNHYLDRLIYINWGVSRLVTAPHQTAMATVTPRSFFLLTPQPPNHHD